MKTLLSTFAIILALFTASAQDQKSTLDNHKNNYVVLTKNVPQLKPILLTAKALQEQDQEKYGEFQVIICGKTVKELTDKDNMKPFLEAAKNENVKIVVCGFSMKKFGVKAKDLPRELEVVSNGILYDFELQKKGYLSIEL
ncbi:Intracellular sulfur oxidation protein, DsrE/DsrF family [Gillisia sp. Hel1_33_143]|uniref:DsrE family protein n=1 Tax=unclassified Gillisia TaxID=2615025 RepID=UPI0005540795|nr:MULTISPECIES: DsrE family protein [unclassified Gillisia]SDS45168.1 Intracellular sulfur oxidation protein, DsrE/DsrF family [Gillisia sp. Hel1_33_143]